jgi:hypothetical protein
MLFRFINPAVEPVDSIRPRRLMNAYVYEKFIHDDIDMGVAIGNHLMGLVEDSPFISLTIDFTMAATTTGTSPGGLGYIVHHAPNIAAFDVPEEYIIRAGTGLQESEGEVLVLLPPGQSLSLYLMNVIENGYMGVYWNAHNLE